MVIIIAFRTVSISIPVGSAVVIVSSESSPSPPPSPSTSERGRAWGLVPVAIRFTFIATRSWSRRFLPRQYNIHHTVLKALVTQTIKCLFGRPCVIELNITLIMAFPHWPDSFDVTELLKLPPHLTVINNLIRVAQGHKQCPLQLLIFVTAFS
jgi:hypothetical protein